MQLTKAIHNSQVKRAPRNTFKHLLKLGHNCQAKAYIANQLRRWHAWLKIRRAYMDLQLLGIFDRITINQLAKKADAHRATVRSCMRSKLSISDIKQALKHWSRLRTKAWGKANYGVEQAKLDSNYLYCEPVGSLGQVMKTEVISYWKKSQPAQSLERLARKTVEKVGDLALRASGLFRLSTLKTPQVGNFSTTDPDPPYD